MGFHLPEEDEYAIALLAGTSPYLGRSFPDDLAHYERFLTLRGCTPEEVAAFREALLGFLRRLTLAHPGQTLVLKSPAHTARVRVLLELFPDARFVHIHRDPYAVFASTRHLYDTVDWFWTLQRRPDDVDDTILRQYALLHAAWFEERSLIAEDRLVELAFEDLSRDPIGALRSIYDALGLDGFDPARSRFEALVADRADHQRNRFPELCESDRARVREAASRCFDAWGYPR